MTAPKPAAAQLRVIRDGRDVVKNVGPFGPPYAQGNQSVSGKTFNVMCRKGWLGNVPELTDAAHCHTTYRITDAAREAAGREAK